MEEDAVRSLRRGRYKLIHDTRSGERALYDLAVDPGETQDVASDHPQVAGSLSESLDAMMQSPRAPLLIGKPTEEEEAQLRALGYLDP